MSLTGNHTNNLFENLDSLPNQVVEILCQFEKEENDYLICMELEQALHSIGYTIDWELDAIPHHLRKSQDLRQKSP